MTADRYWFHVPALASHGAGNVNLPEDQAHHARSVLRMESGAQVIVFDGRGTWAQGTLQTAGKRAAEVALNGPLQHDGVVGRRLTLATAVPKGDRGEWLIEQASQLNVQTVQWLDCDRGVVKPKDSGGGGGGKIDKWRRLAIESAKQCGRTWVLQVEPLLPLETVLAAARQHGARILWLEPRAGQSLTSAAAGTDELLALIGPEGGWSEREIALLEAECSANRATRVKLTPTVLRIETACAAVAAIINSV